MVIGLIIFISLLVILFISDRYESKITTLNLKIDCLEDKLWDTKNNAREYLLKCKELEDALRNKSQRLQPESKAWNVSSKNESPSYMPSTKKSTISSSDDISPVITNIINDYSTSSSSYDSCISSCDSSSSSCDF